jgi:hypothetical protein
MKAFSFTLICLVTLLVTHVSSANAAPALGDAADEYEIKAAMYINLLRLVDWPPGKHGDPAVPLVIGVSGSEDMARALETIARSGSTSSSNGGLPGGRRITVRRISGTVGVEECHSVFVGGGDRKRIESALAATSKNPVLTVGESDRFVSLGGMIDLLLTDDRVQIEVNLEMARNAGFTIGSQLLKIAILKTGGGK